MKLKSLFSITALVTCATLLLASTSASLAQTSRCTEISRVPISINNPGIYCLQRNLQTSIVTGAAISINTDNVVIDLNGFRISNLSAGAGTRAIGVSSTNRQSLTVKNGTVQGFFIALSVGSPLRTIRSHGYLIENVVADRSRSAGIILRANNSIVSTNKIIDTGSSSVVTDATALRVAGANNIIKGNDIVGVRPSAPGQGYGIYLSDAHDNLVENNRVTTIATTGSSRLGTGIFIFTSQRVLVSSNRITDSGRNGILSSFSRSKLFNNLTANVPEPFTRGTQVGINN